MGQGQGICCLASPAINEDPDEVHRKESPKDPLLLDDKGRNQVVTVLPLKESVSADENLKTQDSQGKSTKEWLGSMAPLVAGQDQDAARPAQEPAKVESSAATPRETSPRETTRSGEGESANGRPSHSNRKSGRTSVNDAGQKKDVTARGKPFPKRPLMSKLSQEFWNKAEVLFRRMDPDESNAVTREEAMEFFSGAFNNLSTEAMFNEIDQDRSGAITGEEFMQFWTQVKAAGYKESDMIAELDEILQGGAWVDWKDTRDTTRGVGTSFPRRPWLCKLPVSTWAKCRELFEKIDSDGTLVITPEQASKFFKGGFNKISVDAMFNEIDTERHGSITAVQWMNFWKQVKTSGYSRKNIEEEIDLLMEGGTWVDWKDGRRT